MTTDLYTAEPAPFWRRFGISSSTLKIIAMVAMVIDHAAVALIMPYMEAVYGYNESFVFADDICRYIGRLAFPIFCFLLVQGYLHTRNVRKYATRLAVFAVLSEVPFDLAGSGKWVDFGAQNVLWTLLLGLLTIVLVEYVQKLPMVKEAPQPCLWSWLAVVPMAILAYVLKTDYDAFGVLLICILYATAANRRQQLIVGALAVAWETTAPLAFIPIAFYNGKRGLPLKWFFYLFYPVHLLIYGILRLALVG